MARLKRFDDFRFVGTRDTMKVYDCDDAEQLLVLERRVEKGDLYRRNQLQTFGPDTVAEAANRGFESVSR